MEQCNGADISTEIAGKRVDGDYVLIVTASLESNQVSGIKGSNCFFDKTSGRPLMGTMNFDFSKLKTNFDRQKNFNKTIGQVLYQLAFDITLWKNWNSNSKNEKYEEGI